MEFLLIVIPLLVIIGGIVCCVKKRSRSAGIALLVLGAALFLIGNSIVIVPTGYVGVRTRFGQISDVSVTEGFNWKVPFIEQITTINVKQQDMVVDGQIWGESSEKTPVFAEDVVVTYQISAEKAAWLYAHINRTDYITLSLVSSALKSAMVELDTSSVTVRSKVEPLALQKLNDALAEKYGKGTVTAVKVIVNQMDFEASYNEAIAAKNIAKQVQEQRSIENQTAIAKAEADKQVALAAAQAEAEASKIKAEAEAEVLRITTEAKAEANKKLAASLDENVLKSRFYEVWDGKLPTVMGDSAVITDIAN